MICADCGQDIIIIADPGQLLETEHDCPMAAIDEDVWLIGVTVFEAKRLRKGEK